MDDTSRRRVMLVDDHPIWLDALTRDLEAEGFQVVAVAHTGEECLRRLPATLPDVVVMDLNIPEPDGATCTEIIARDYPDINVLVMSASCGSATTCSGPCGPGHAATS